MLFTHKARVLLIISSLGFVACEKRPSTLSQDQALANIKSRVNFRNAKSSNIKALRSASMLWPSVESYQTIGDYLDDVDKILNSTLNDTAKTYESNPQMAQRNLVRTDEYRQSAWFDGKEHYNISMSRCVHFSEIIGKWTDVDGTTQNNATLANITTDLQTRFENMTELSNHLKTRIIANAELAASEAEASLKTTMCNYDQPAAHDELRKLLAPTPFDHLNAKFLDMDGHWTNVIMSMGVHTAVVGSLYKGLYNRNATLENTALICFTAAGLVFTRGVIERLYMMGKLRFVEASVIAAFTSWFRRAVELALLLLQGFMPQIGADQTSSGCLEEADIENGADGLQGYSEPGAGIIELVPMGWC